VDELASTHNELKYKQKIFYFSPSRLLTEATGKEEESLC